MAKVVQYLGRLCFHVAIGSIIFVYLQISNARSLGDEIAFADRLAGKNFTKRVIESCVKTPSHSKNGVYHFEYVVLLQNHQRVHPTSRAKTDLKSRLPSRSYLYLNNHFLLPYTTTTIALSTFAHIPSYSLR